MKCARLGVNGGRAAATRGARWQLPTNERKELAMKSNKQKVVRNPSRKIADSRRIRYGTGCAPVKVARAAPAATADSGAIRFGTGCAPASLRK